MGILKERDCVRFPLNTVDSVVSLVIDQLDARDEPNLALLSIVLGAVEQSLTVNVVKNSSERNEFAVVHNSLNKSDERSRAIPVITLESIESLYEQFVTMVKSAVDMTGHRGEYTSLECLKKVSDVLWDACPSTVYKDKVHLQTLYTLLTDNKTDCFGMALGIVAACQVLGLRDVHLAITEDHAWAVFGENGSESAEITWHGRGTEDRRGQPVTRELADKNWLYQNPIVCSTRHLEMVAMVSSINPSVSTTSDSAQVALIQHKLLWALYDRGLLNKYPMALGTLADMEEMSPTVGRPTSLSLYLLAVDNTVKHCNDLFIYPYTYIGNYYYRHRQYKDALKYWATAAQVVSRYNYDRADEVIYKEFLEIANEIIPNIVRLSSSATAPSVPPPPSGSTRTSTVAFLSDPETFANLLRFYDGICLWEEGSSTPVLHIVWATHMCFSLSRFEAKVRDKVDIENYTSDDEDDGPSNLPREKPAEESCAPAGSKSVVESPESPTEASDCDRAQTLKVIPFHTDSPGGDADKGLPGAAGQPQSRSALQVSTSSERVTRLVEAARSDRIKLLLYSGKMTAMRELFLGEKLNVSAIKLQLTAQSTQVHVKPSRPSVEAPSPVPAPAARKRPRNN